MTDKDREERKPQGPYTLWRDYGYEGWAPEDFPSVAAALEADKHCCRWVITAAPVQYEVIPQ